MFLYVRQAPAPNMRLYVRLCLIMYEYLSLCAGARLPAQDFMSAVFILIIDAYSYFKCESRHGHDDLFKHTRGPAPCMKHAGNGNLWNASDVVEAG